MAKAIDDGDARLIMEINQYMVEKAKRELKDEYMQERRSQEEQAKQQTIEWNQIRDEYKEFSNPSEPEVFANSQRDLDINNPHSLLVQLAQKLYMSEEEDKMTRYRRPGGMQLAVSDAFKLILQRKLKGKVIL